jgi:hypothetical protein
MADMTHHKGLEAPDEQAASGAPTWMLTYADSVTLLVTFFVLLMTFSTPNEEDFQKLSRGLMAGARPLGLLGGRPDEMDLSPASLRSRVSRMSDEGGENRPMHSETALAELTGMFENIDVNDLPELAGAQSIRVPLGELFVLPAVRDDLSMEGRRIVERLSRVVKGDKFEVVVRLRAPQAVPKQGRHERMCELGTVLVQRLRRASEYGGRRIGLSTDVSLVEPEPGPGMVEFMLLEMPSCP